MGVFKAFDLVPQKVDLSGTPGPHLSDGRRVVHPLSSLEDGYQQLLGGEVGKDAALPGGVRVKELQGLALVHHLVPQGNKVGKGLAGLVVKETVHLLEARIGNFIWVGADLDLGDDGPFLVLHRRQLVHAAEHRLALGGNKPLTHAEGVDLGPLEQQVPDNILVQRVGGHDLTLGQSRRVQHFSGLLGQVGQIPRVQPDGAVGNALGKQYLFKGTNGVGHARLQHIIGIHQQGGRVGIKLAVGLEGGILVGEHLNPGVGHGAPCRGAVHLVSQGAGSTGAAGDVRGPSPQDGSVGSLRPAGAELAHRPPICRPHDAVGLGGDEGLVVQGEQQEGFDELGLNGGRPDGEEGLPGEDGRAFGHRPDIAGKPEGAQIVQKTVAEAALAPQVGNILLVKVEPLHIVDDLLQTGGNGKTAPIRHIAEKDVKITDLVGVALRLEVAVAHGELIEVTEQSIVHVLLHGIQTSRLITVMCRASIRSSTCL